MKEYIDAMSDEEMAIERWENEGGRTSAVMKTFLLSATISLFLSMTAMAQGPGDIRIEPYTFVTNDGRKIEAEFGRIYVPAQRLATIIVAMAQTRSKPIVFTHATVIDATGADAQSDMVVIVTGETITEIGKFGKIEFPKNSQVIDATGKFLIPGLWDMHVHLTKAGENTLPLFIANGITSVRDMGGDYVQLLKWRKEAAGETRLSPRIKTPGALLESAENVARMKREGTVEPVDKFRIGIATPEGARKRNQGKRYWRMLKLPPTRNKFVWR